MAAFAATAIAVSGAAKADATIGVNGPMTGPYAVFGDQMKRGAEFASADINAKGGLLGQTIKVMVGDDACDPKQAVSVANKLFDLSRRFAGVRFTAIKCGHLVAAAERILDLIRAGESGPAENQNSQGFHSLLRE